MEGADSRERGEDTQFERHTALLALAKADVIIFNVNCGSVGTLMGSCMLLLHTALQVKSQLSVLMAFWHCLWRMSQASCAFLAP
jgi:hypothetical protein